MICIKGTLVYESGQGVRKDSTKSFAGFREIPMIDSSEKLLKQLWKKRVEMRMVLGENWKERKGLENLVLFNAFGSSLCDTNVRKDINQIVERINQAGIEFEHITPHTFRHPYVKHKTKSFSRNFRVFQSRILRPHGALSHCSSILRSIAVMPKSTSPLFAVWMLISRSRSRCQY